MTKENPNTGETGNGKPRMSKGCQIASTLTFTPYRSPAKPPLPSRSVASVVDFGFLSMTFLSFSFLPPSVCNNHRPNSEGSILLQ